MLLVFENLTNINDKNYNNIFSNFIQIIKNFIDVHAPIIKLMHRQQQLKSKPWVTKSFLTSIKNKQTLYLSHFVYGNNVQRQYYKFYANKLKKIKVTAKKLHYANKLISNKKTQLRYGIS